MPVIPPFPVLPGRVLEGGVVGVETGPSCLSPRLTPVVSRWVHSVFHPAVPAGSSTIVGFSFVGIREDVVGGDDEAVALHFHSTREGMDVGVVVGVPAAVGVVQFYEGVEAVFAVGGAGGEVEDLVGGGG